MLTRCEGIVLRTYALGDTSRIAVVYTRELGLVKLVAKGARKTPSRFGVALEPLTHGRYVLYHKVDRELQLLSQADTLAPHGAQLTELSRLSHAQAAAELVDRLVWGGEPHQELFELLCEALDLAERVAPAAVALVTVGMELRIAALLGYRPRLDACVECGGLMSARRLFSAARGGMLCDRCAAMEPGAVGLSADALGSMALLLDRPLAEAVEMVDARRAGELQRVAEDYLRAHFQRFAGLRSLEVLRSLPGGGNGEGGRSGRGPGPTNPGAS
jgi:DNA repair protein RecO (recombination protein O)